jgi:threonine dehydratase
MTSDTAPYKVERTRAFGAEVLFCGTTFESRFETVAKLEAERGSVVLHPFDSPETIAGDGTLALELLEQLPGPFTVGVPASGGGLISGVAAVLKSPLLEEASRGATVVGFQPEAGGAVFRSLEAGTRVNVGKVHTIADALVASIPGVRTFELIRSFCEGFRLVGERELAQAMLWLLEEEKLWVEPGGAAAVAGALFGREALPGGRGPLVLVLTGGNLDPRRLGEITALL